MRLTCEKRHPLTREEPTDPAGNPDPPDHWDLVPELIVQAPTLFGGRRDAFQMAPFEHPHPLWFEAGVWRIDPYGGGRDRSYERDLDFSTYQVVGGALVGTLDPAREYLLRHFDDGGECGVELVPREDT